MMHDLQELFQFYREKVKVLYSYCQEYNELPQETLFEINAAWDHIGRHFDCTNPQKLEHVVEKAQSHLKRSCLDLFKLALKNAVDQYRDINKTDLSLIDNGNGAFKRELVALLKGIREKSEIARKEEGRNFDHAYDVWWEMYLDCRKLEKSYYYSDKVKWAKKKAVTQFLWTITASFVAGILSTLAVQNWNNILQSVKSLLFSVTMH
ncbi:MAG: hypothetical protein FWD64_05735 [Acidobacteriaceae bacterium]|nr:hypothetical protein [Acidobacteriaceae bacterium]